MKNDINKIKEQNAISTVILKFLLQNEDLKLLIQKFGAQLAKNILVPIIESLKNSPSNELNEIHKNIIDYLLEQHSSKDRQYDGLRTETDYESLNTDENKVSLLQEMNDRLLNINLCNSIQRLANYFKIMYDVSAAFVQEHAKIGDVKFQQLRTIIMPTVSEYNSRINFSEAGKKQYATTFGLFATPRDLVDENSVTHETPIAKARTTGKSLFEEISTIKRYRMVFINYLSALKAYQDKNKAKEIYSQEQIESAEIELVNQIQKMIYLDIPLHFTLDDSYEVERIAIRNETWIEKIAKELNKPLVSGVSGSTGRLLIALIHFNCFDLSEESINQLQLLANCVAAHMAFQGHHSFEEVHEATRRSMDALMILDTAKSDNSLVLNHSLYRVVTDNSFLHYSYMDKILEEAKDYLSSADSMPFQYNAP